MNQIDSDLIKQFFNDVIYVKNHCAEVRCFHSRVDRVTKRIVRSEEYNTTVAGWFDRADELLCELSRINGVSAYITVNPVSLSSRPRHARNNLKVLNAKNREFVTDEDVTIIRYLIIDIDPIRLESHHKINSTTEELNACIAVRDAIIADVGLQESCIPGISGNGCFILVCLSDHENNEEYRNNLIRLAKYIASRHDNKSCKIDIQTCNPSRLLPIPGTWKYRDSVSTVSRPHRLVQIQLPDQSNDAHASETVRSRSMDGGESVRSTSF